MSRIAAALRFAVDVLDPQDVSALVRREGDVGVDGAAQRACTRQHNGDE